MRKKAKGKAKKDDFFFFLMTAGFCRNFDFEFNRTEKEVMEFLPSVVRCCFFCVCASDDAHVRARAQQVQEALCSLRTAAAQPRRTQQHSRYSSYISPSTCWRVYYTALVGWITTHFSNNTIGDATLRKEGVKIESAYY